MKKEPAPAPEPAELGPEEQKRLIEGLCADDPKKRTAIREDKEDQWLSKR